MAPAPEAVAELPAAEQAAPATVTKQRAQPQHILQLDGAPQQSDMQQPAHNQRQHQDEHHAAAAAATPAAAPAAAGRRYLAFFLHRHLDFRVPELTALAQLAGVAGPVALEPLDEDAAAASCGGAWPLRYVWLPDDATAAAIMERSMLCKGLFEPWAQAGSLQELLAALLSLPADVKGAATAPDATFRLNLSAVGFRWGTEQYASVVKQLIAAAGFRGRVDLGAPSATFWAIAVDSDGQCGLPPMPRRWVFGRQVALGDRGVLARYALPQRAYIGPTSMDPELAFIMANMAHVRRGQLVLDPYLGTGSIAVAAAACGAHTLGCDIDARVIMLGKPASGQTAAQQQQQGWKRRPQAQRQDGAAAAGAAGSGALGDAAVRPQQSELGNGSSNGSSNGSTSGSTNGSTSGSSSAAPRLSTKQPARCRVTVWSNFDQYRLPRPLGLLRADVHRHPFRVGLSEVVDAMLGDPPYGVRAGGRKSCARPGAMIRDRATHIPPTAPYGLTECLDDLLQLAAQLLVTGGRLVFWMPSAPDLYREDELPAHPMLSMVANSEQMVSARYSRRLITMVKVRPYDAAAAAAWRRQRKGCVMALERLAELVYTPRDGVAAGGGGGGSALSAPLDSSSSASTSGDGGSSSSSVPKYRGKNL